MSPHVSEFPNTWHEALAGLLIILLVILPVEQILTLKILRQEDNRRKRLTPYLVNLVVANLMFIFFSATFSVDSNLSRRYVSNKPTCIAFGYFSSAAVLVTFATLAACTVTAYHAATELKTTHLIIKRRKETKIILGIWFFSLVILSPMIIIWKKETFHPSTFRCKPFWTLKTPEDIAYFVILTILGFSTPMIFNLVYSFKIYLLFASINLRQMTYCQRRRYQECKNVSKMMIASVVVYLFCWTPFTIVQLVSLFGYTSSPGLRAIPYLLSKTSTLYNPIIYAIFNAK